MYRIKTILTKHFNLTVESIVLESISVAFIFVDVHLFTFKFYFPNIVGNIFQIIRILHGFLSVLVVAFYKTFIDNPFIKLLILITFFSICRWSPSLRMVGDGGGQLSEFIEGLGPGQLVGRQVLGAPALGDIQLSLCYQKGFLEVEVIRARGLQVVE